jgi:hypothetical protein
VTPSPSLYCLISLVHGTRSVGEAMSILDRLENDERLAGGRLHAEVRAHEILGARGMGRSDREAAIRLVVAAVGRMRQHDQTETTTTTTTIH